ncbi:MAG: FUSC family protein [Synechococcaceae cyanobacterium ELA739]
MSSTARPLLTRADLRLALTAGLSAGLTIALGLPDPVYGPLAVAAVLGGTVGASRTMGIQRMQGTLLGGVILAILHPTLSPIVPMPIGVAVALACTRLFGGSLGLHSGYKVAGLVVGIGWTAHASQLSSWIPLRLLVTLIGVLLSWLAVAQFWPSRALDQRQELTRRMNAGFAEALRQRALQMESGIEEEASARVARRNGLLALLLQLQSQRPEAETELTSDRLGKGLRSLWDLQEQLYSSLIASYRTLLRLPMVPMIGPSLTRLLAAEVAGLRAVADRLDLWSRQSQDLAIFKQRRDQDNDLAAALADLESAEAGVFADAGANALLMARSGGRRAVACQQLLSSAIRFEEDIKTLQ